jgi:hypothetical protein
MVIHIAGEPCRPENGFGFRLAAGAHVGGLGLEIRVAGSEGQIERDVSVLQYRSIVQKQRGLEELGVEQLVLWLG